MKTYQTIAWIVMFITLLFFAETWMNCKAQGGELSRTVLWYECDKPN